METNSMIDLKKHTIEELQVLLEQVKSEISNRWEFDKEFKLSQTKAYKGPSRAQIEFAEHLGKKTDSKIIPTMSQIMKYFEKEDMSEAIDLMKSGKRIKIS